MRARSLWVWVLFVLSVPLLFSQAGNPSPVLRIDEQKIQLQTGQTSRLELPVFSAAHQPLPAHLRVELLQQDGKTLGSKDMEIVVVPGSHAVAVPWPIGTNSDSISVVYWWRLHYAITPSAQSDFQKQEGIVQLSQIIPDLPRIQVATLSQVLRSTSFPLRVRVDDVRTGKALSGVWVEAEWDLEDEKQKQHPPVQHTKTDAHGDAVFIFKVPADLEKDPHIYITAQRGSWFASKSIELELLNRADVTVSTDKPIYQPGQVLHLRALIFGPGSHALANAAVKFVVTDEDRNSQFETEVKTSEFGVARADWEIPEKLQLGDYSVRVDVNDMASIGWSKVRISRYELPQFTVDPSTDKTFYLPGQKPRLEVKANYLFGQPVKRAQIRIVRDKGRTWNSEKKEYEADQEEVALGELDSAAKFTATLDVDDDFHDLSDHDYLRYRDLRFAAYVTDLSTQRTEQKHFTVRLSKEPIHIYVLHPHLGNSGPLDYYVITCFPDGTPASVAVAVSAVKPDDNGEFPDDPLAAQRLEIARLRTNKYGVAHLRARELSPEFASTRYSRQIRLLFEASDRKIGKAIHSEQIWFREDAYLHINAAASLLRPGENVVASIESSLPDQKLFVHLLDAETVLGSQQVMLKHGHAQVEFPYDDRFRNRLVLMAYTLNWANESNPIGSTQVLYPEPQDLDLKVRLPGTTFKPGEPTLATFRVRAPDGKPARSALGVLVYDKAVAERVRSDQEFGRYGFYFPGDDTLIAGISYHDLLNRKLTAPVPPDFELLAEAILTTTPTYFEMLLEAESHGSPGGAFAATLSKTLHDTQVALNFSARKTTLDFPRNMEQLHRVLESMGVNFDDLRDPWGMPFRVRFSSEGTQDVVQILSNGPDKLPDTDDDFLASTSRWTYFAPIGLAIDEVTKNYSRDTGDYIRDFDSLARELKSRRGIDLHALSDPWGHSYSFNFEVNEATFMIRVLSAGPDGAFTTREKYSKDDVPEWTSSVHYFQRETAALESALADHFRKTGNFPTSDEELRPVLEASGLSPQSLLDPWGHPYHFVFSESTRYWDRMSISSYSVYEGQTGRSTTVTPVTQKLRQISVTSFGAGNNPQQQFRVADFTRVVAEQSSKDLAPLQTSAVQVPSTGGTGAIRGTVTDPQGAVIQGAQVAAVNTDTGARYSTISDSDGVYLLSNLPAGRYQIEVVMPGFETGNVTAVPVTSSNLTSVDVRLNVGSASETIEVAALSAEATLVNTESATVAGKSVNAASARVQAEQQAFTPRLRKYFPETLLWQPELVTDSSGKAQIKFAMADNITTWKMSVVASNTSGQLGLAEKELRTFQPFFIDNEPPKILTQGDQINLPIVLRNYLNKTQQVNVKLEQGPWFSLLSAPQQQIEVPAGQDAIAQFSISADHSVREGKERVTAANRETGDAVERAISVHPDGEDVSQTVAALLSGERNTLNVRIPANAIPGSVDAQLKIYPNIGSHVLDSLNALAIQPAGCAEQITSIAFVSVMVLQLLHKAGQDDPQKPGNPNAALAARARKYVTAAYQQLGNLQAGSGGFPYWRNNQPDVAVTAHVLDFLVQASEFIKVDDAMIAQARRFLASNQSPEGAWLRSWYGSKSEINANLTALVARVLAEADKKLPVTAKASEAQPALSKAMKFLEARIAEWRDPYVVGQYALAASMNGRAEYIGKAQELLRQLAHEEGPGTYWNLEANTSPFYSWGSAGRVETSGLAVRALSWLPKNTANNDTQRLLDRGLLYLLNHKDRYGSWYSTQATVNVLRAIVDAMPAIRESTHAAGPADVLANGKQAATLHLPSSNGISGPITAELPGLLAAGENRVEVRRQTDGSSLQAQLITTHYIPWADSQATNKTAFKIGESRSLRLKVTFDHTDAQVGKSIQCTVEAERIGFAGYGMMLAEIGLPPGADVDRASLERALTGSDVSEFDVLPDRVVLYLWPQAGGSKLTFSFKPRFAMNASAAPSILYDYYNPEARATVAPVRFMVH